MLDSKMILGITISAAGRQMKSTKILPARSDKGCSVSLATQFSKSITNRNLLRATFSTSFFFDPRSTLLVLFMFMVLASQGFLHAQFIRFWFICMKPMSVATTTFNSCWRHPGSTAPKHQKALWVASTGSIPPAPLFPRHNNSRVYETMCVGPIHDAPSCHTKPAEGCSFDMCFLSLRMLL